LLKKHCNGVIKEFASKLNKNERQCSNFLREKNPHNIGNMIARQIEMAFGYPSGWLDISDEVDQIEVEHVGSEYASLIDTIDGSLSKLNQKIFNSPSLKESVWLNEKVESVQNKSGRLLAENRNSLIKVMAHDFLEFMFQTFSISLSKTSSEIVFTSPNFIFRFQPMPARTEHERHFLPSEVLNGYKDKFNKGDAILFDIKPIIVNEKLSFLFEEKSVLVIDNSTTDHGEHFRYTMALIDSYKAHDSHILSKIFNSKAAFFEDKSLLMGCERYIDTHPKLLK